MGPSAPPGSEGLVRATIVRLFNPAPFVHHSVMTISAGVVMDPIGSIKVHKDSTFAMLLEGQRRGWRLHYIEPRDLYLRNGVAHARSRDLTVRDDPHDWFNLGEPGEIRLRDLDTILMRRDPPFTIQYIADTYVLEHAAAQGALVVNDPRSLRDANEKMFTGWFPQCCAPTLVSRDPAQLKAFLAEHGEVVFKPLDGMGGVSIFRVADGDLNTNVILETLNENGFNYVMAQRFIPEIRDGDKRILLIDGEAVPHALARIPAEGEFRGNLAVGAKSKGVDLTDRDRWLCEQVAPVLREKGLIFTGLDVIGDYITEINVTSPTCIRELDTIYGLNIAGQLLDSIESRLTTKT